MKQNINGIKLNLILVVLLFLFVCSCKDNVKIDRTVEAICIKEITKHISKNISISKLIESGYSNLSFYIITNNNETIQSNELIAYADLFLKHGYFNHAQNILNKIGKDSLHLNAKLVRLSIYLNQMDTVSSKIILHDCEKEINHSKNKSFESIINLKLYQAYHLHNCTNYIDALRTLDTAEVLLKKIPTNYNLVALINRRRGNTFNDLFRKKITINFSAKQSFRKAMLCYKNELEALNKLKQIDPVRIGLNYNTTGLLYACNKEVQKAISLQEKALSYFITNKKLNYTLSKHPIYTTITLTQLAESYMHLNPQKIKIIDSLMELNEQFIKQEFLTSINDSRGSVMNRFYTQRYNDIRISVRLNQNNTSTDLLNLSNQTKYQFANFYKSLLNKWGYNYHDTLKEWLILNEIKILYQQYNWTLNPCIEKHYKTLSKDFSFIGKKAKNPTLKDSDVKTIQDYCKLNQSTYIDYQSYGRHWILATFIDSNGLRYYYNIPELDISHLNLQLKECIQNNDVSRYEKVAKKITEQLYLNKVNTPNIVICNDEYTENVAIEALVNNTGNGISWKNLDYLINSHTFRFIPNYSFLLNNINYNLPIDLGIVFKKEDDKSLPYNKTFRAAIRNIATINCMDNPKVAKPWMHFISHSMSVLFDEYKSLSVKSNYQNSIDKTSVLILHGCATGGGKIAPSEGLKSIQQQYIYKGVPTIISSYWDADNLSSSVMFQDLYQNLHTGKSLSSMVRQSKIKIKNYVLHPEWANPIYWANFKITGSDILLIQ